MRLTTISMGNQQTSARLALTRLLAWAQVQMEGLDAIIFVKVLEAGFQLLQNSSVPLLWDHVDEWDGFPFW